MAVDTEAIYAALADRLMAVAGVRTVQRRDKAVPSEMQPAILVLDEQEQESSRGEGMPPLLELNGKLILLARTMQHDPSPTTQINKLVQSVREVLETQPSDGVGQTGSFYGHAQHYTNLGGLVASFSLDGSIEKYPGDETGQAMAILPWSAVAL